MSPAGPRGIAGGRPLSPSRGGDYRCAAAAEQRHDDLAGTATHLNAFLLVEHSGPWGGSAPRDSRLPDDVKRHLTTEPTVKVLLARRHHRAERGTTCRAFVCFPRQRLLVTSTFEDPRELLALDLAAVALGQAPDWAPHPGPVFGVCTHGRHDACCAERGRPVAAALCESHPDQTWEVSHTGGDRFSANMVVLPEGLYYGRMDAASASDVARLHETGRLDLERLRGSSTVPMHVQYAEIALRRHLEEDRLDAVRLTRRAGAVSEFEHRSDADTTRWAVTVARSTRGEAQLTCGVERLNPLPVHEVLAIQQI